MIGLYSEELRMVSKNTVQLTIHEMQTKIEKQKRLLDERKQEIEELKDLLGSVNAKKTQRPSTPPEGYKGALDTVYKIMSSLEKYTPEEVLFYAAPILAKLMATEDAAIYMVVNKSYARLFSSTSAKARELGNSIKYTALDDMYDTLMDGNVYINKEVNPLYPSMASALFDDDEIQLILMFWGIPKQQMTPEEANRLTVIMTLFQNAVLRAKRYMSSFRRLHYMEGTNVLNEEAFTALVKTFLEAKSKGLTQCALAEIVMGYQSYDNIAVQLSGNIRQTDYMGIINGERLYILLSNTDIKNAEVVRKRLHKIGYSCVLKESLD